jgi:hypothetical protein
MSPASEQAFATLRLRAHNHPGASSSEWAAWEPLQNFEKGRLMDSGDCFSRLDGHRKRAVLQLVVDITSGRSGVVELRKATAGHASSAVCPGAFTLDMRGYFRLTML